MKKIVTLTLICLFFQGLILKTNAQGFFTSDTVIRKYNAATSEPDANWYMPGFDDSSWAPDDSGSVGYGYTNIRHTVISSSTKSLYERIIFQVDDTSAITHMNLLIDSDDGYIAYINGQEVARVNVDTTKFPAFDATAIQGHKIELNSYRTYPSLGVYLDKPVLRKCLFNGDNVLAIHVLNASLGDNSLMCYPNLINLNKTGYDFYIPNSRYKRLIEIDSSDIPLVVINTDENSIPREGSIVAHMEVIDNGIGKYNKLSDLTKTYDGLISMKIRGQSSSYFPKQSYRIELNDAAGNDTGFALLGMPKESDWILFGPFTDKSQIRNKFVYDLGSKLGNYNPRSRYCELILNGQSVGLYMLTEKIKPDKNRLDIAKLKETDISGLDVTGGYIFKLDKSDASSVFLKSGRQVEYPSVLKPEQRAYCERFFNSYDSVLNCNNFCDPVNGYRKFVSDSSLIDYVIINEITKNADAYRFSAYFYKDKANKDNRIKFGPLWDYDLALGNTTFQEGNITNKWQYEFNTGLRITRFFQDTALVDLFQQRWTDLRQKTLSNDSIFAFMDTLLSYTEKARIRNYEVWPIIDKTLQAPGYYVTTYDAEIATMKKWLTDRLAWIDANIEKVYYPLVLRSTAIETLTGIFNFSVYPNPFVDNLNVSLYLEEPSEVRIEVINLTGQVQYMVSNSTAAGNYEVNLTDERTSSLNPGMYLVRLYLNDIPVSTQKIIKN